MNKNEFISRLTAIQNQIRFCTEEEFQEMFNEGSLTFAKYEWAKPEKTIVKISVQTIRFTDKDEMLAQMEKEKNEPK
ncbi:MAG: hypothetical protein WC089_03695 [Candidatus Paceibacterota bacterium]